MRLIDADKLYEEIEEGQKSALGLIDDSRYSNITNIDDCLESIKYADTIESLPIEELRKWAGHPSVSLGFHGFRGKKAFDKIVECIQAGKYDL